jgi:PPOX class probable F420-dependent enzyme
MSEAQSAGGQSAHVVGGPTPGQRRFIAAARRAILATVAPDGRPRLVPVCYALAPDADDADDAPALLYSPIDDKPKRSADPRRLARVRDIEARSSVSMLVDRWDEDWSSVAWVRVDGVADILWPDVPIEAPGRRAAIALLREKYPQYAAHGLEALPIIRIVATRIVAWGALDATP